MNGCRYLSIYADSYFEAGKVIRSNLTRGVILAMTPLCILVSLIIISGCSTGDNTRQAKKNIVEEKINSKKGDTSIGKGIYEKYCHYCHGMEGRGDGAIAIGLTPHPVDFVNDVDRMKKSDEALFESISRGIHRKIGGDSIAMPQWDLILTKDEIGSVLTYIRYLSEKGRTEDAKDRKNR